MIYFLIFIFIIELTFCFEHTKNKQSKIILATLIILTLSFLAGSRSPNIGTDNLVYAEFYQKCVSSSLKQIFIQNSSEIESFEVGFVFLTWMISRIGSDFYTFAFFTSLISFSFIFLGINYYKARFSMSISIMAFLFMFYCPLLNYVRQGIALSIAFFSWRYAEERKVFKYMFFVVIASTIHIGALIAFPIYVIFSQKSNNYYIKYIILVIIVVVVAIIAGPNLIYHSLVFASKFGIRTWTLLKYSRRFLSVENYSIVLPHLFQVFPQLVISTFLYFKIKEKDSSIKCFYLMTWIQLLFLIMGSVYQNFSRIALFYSYSNIFLFSSMCKYIKKMEIPIFFYCILFWYVYTVQNAYGFSLPVYPYVSTFH